MSFDLQKVQAALAQFGLDGWLLYDFRGSNPLARRVLEIDSAAITTRRYCYCIPAEGPPRKLVHRIEAGTLDHLPGEKTVYLRWQEWEAGISRLLTGLSRVAVEYSPRNANPYVSRVDGGLIELMREQDVHPESSGDLIQLFEAVWTPEQWELHQQTAVLTDAAFTAVWNFITEQVRDNGATDELSVQRVILDHFAEHELVTDHPPIVAVGPNAGDPHYETGIGKETTITAGSLVLVDLWAKKNLPQAVFSDLTRMAYVGGEVPEQHARLFAVVAAARDAAIETVRAAMRDDRPLQGWEVDRACRNVIDAAGLGEFFVHRTGHSIGRETHGNGANMDDLETHEERRVLPGTCFSVEPGIYRPDVGMRSEVNVYIDEARGVHVTGGEIQTAIRPLLA